MTTTTTRNGWHHATITVAARTTSLPCTWDVTWRTQRAECAGHFGSYGPWDTVAVWDAANPPFAGGDQRGELQPAHAQCGNCGRMFAGEFTAIETL